MEIKTIRNRLDFSEEFDEEVNKALADGWMLTRRYINTQHTPGHYRMLIAELTRHSKEEKEKSAIEIKVKYFDQDIPKLEKIEVGDWIDLRSAVTVDLKKGEYYAIPLGVGMILPDGYEAHIAPRSSTYKNFGILMCCSGIIDNSYSGNDDQWTFGALACRDTHIKKGDRICQFRLFKNMELFKITEVEKLNDVSRGGIGSTGKR